VVRSAAMRDASSLDPMWEPDTPRSLRGAALLRGAARLAHTVAPFVVTWVQGMKPQLRLAWGATEYHVRRDGIAALRRSGQGFEDNPRSNYNERVQKRQEKAATSPASPAQAPRPAADRAAAGPEDVGALKATIARVRASLQALDDVKDWATVESLEDEVNRLHRTIEDTMRRHEPSRRTSKPGDPAP